MLTLTANAKKYLEEQLKEKGHKYVGLSLKPSGCAGFEYVWDYADEDHNGRVVADLVVVEQNAELAVAGSVVDYNSSLAGSELTINNPNVQDACGCGVSFTL
jgi:iron-sulfur cluster assembly accessory protein|tara:strand:+ start:409 stop:714 length:306 start_codon:yes stop_codon:yes gene_type:complete